jgi:hypothetical protein
VGRHAGSMIFAKCFVLTKSIKCSHSSGVIKLWYLPSAEIRDA